MRKALFIDRDGTIIVEPPVDNQVDSLLKLQFVPNAISALSLLCHLDFDLVLATNQDGLGTPAFPYADFIMPHQMMLDILAGEGVVFHDQLIDPTLPADNAPTRKPAIGMFGDYLDGSYDMARSYVIGDRISDMQLAANLGCKGILLADPARGAAQVSEAALSDAVVLVSNDWLEIAQFVRLGQRRCQLRRTTRETDVDITIDLDNKALPGWSIDTGLKFLDHMLDQIAHHGGIAIDVKARGDLEVDEHHLIEDVAIVLGDVVYQALGDKRGIGRYGFALPMDDCRALVLLDFGGRIALEWDADFNREYVGDFPTEMFKHFFQSFCASARCNLYVQARGENEHHKAEAIFKALARALRMAVARNQFGYDIPSSKGIL